MWCMTWRALVYRRVHTGFKWRHRTMGGKVRILATTRLTAAAAVSAERLASAALEEDH